MTDDLYSKKLARFKQNEKPETLLVVADHPERIRIVVAWTNLDVRRSEKPTKLRGESDGEVWEWLWENARYSRMELMQRIGISLSESALEAKLNPLIGNRVLYPDGTVNSFVQRYLREQVVKLFETKSTKLRKKS